MKKQLVICGGGSSSHTLIPFLKDSDFDVSVYTSRPEMWSKTIELEWHNPSGEVLGTYSGKIKTVSNNPEVLFPTADYVVFCMPVHKYRVALHQIAPYINNKHKVFLGTVYGQGGWNWMVDEIQREYGLTNIVTFAFGLIPWICRLIEYGKKGVTYGPKAVNYGAVYPNSYFNQVKAEFFDVVCYRWFGKGETEKSENFISLTLSVDNQIIHTSRCLGLYEVWGKTWKTKEEVPWFYRDYDETSAQLLKGLDEDYEKIRQIIRERYPDKNFKHMLDYLSLERFSYKSQNTNIRESFVTSQTLVSIQTPVVRNEKGLWEIDKNHRFFLDDIYYGNCIAKWIAERQGMETPIIDKILRWAQLIRQERIIDNNNKLILNSPDLNQSFKSGIPSLYGYDSLDDIID